MTIEKPCYLPICFSSQCVLCISLAAGDFVSSGLFATCLWCVLYIFDDVCFLSCMQASLSGFSSVLTAMLVLKALFVLMEARAYVLSLRWLRVMVTLKVCVCCSSILSSSDTLTKGHQAKAWRKPARNLQEEKRIGFLEFWDRLLEAEEFLGMKMSFTFGLDSSKL